MGQPERFVGCIACLLVLGLLASAEDSSDALGWFTRRVLRSFAGAMRRDSQYVARNVATCRESVAKCATCGESGRHIQRMGMGGFASGGEIGEGNALYIVQNPARLRTFLSRDR